MSIFGKAVRLLTRAGNSAAFGFVADLAWEMLKAEKTGDAQGLAGKDKLSIVLSWVSKTFANIRGTRYEELITAVTELIAAAKKVVNLVRKDK